MEMNLDSFDVRGSLMALARAIRRHVFLVVLTCAVTVALMIAYMHYFPSVYRGAVKLLVESETDLVRNEFYDRWNVFRGVEEGETEAELLRVAPVIKEVIERLDLHYEDVYHPFMKHVVYLWGESWIGSNYRKVKRLIFPIKKTPWDPTEEEIELAKCVDDFRKGIDIQSEGNSSVASIAVLGPSKRVAEMADTLIEVYLEHRNERHRKEAMAAYDLLSEQVTLAYDTLRKTEEELAQFSEEYAVKFDFEKERRQVIDWAAQETALMKTQAEVKQKEERLAEVERQLKEVPDKEISARSTVLNELKVKLDADLLDQQIAVVDLKNRFTLDSVEVREALSNIEEVKKKIGEIDEMVLNRQEETANPVWSNLREERSRLRIELAELRKAEVQQAEIVAHFEQSLKDLPQKQHLSMDLSRRLTIANTEYQLLLEKQRQAYISGLTQMQDMGSVKVVEKAAVPAKPLRPKKKLFLLASVLAGLLMGAGVALAADYVDDRIHNLADLEEAWGGQVYARISLAGADKRPVMNASKQG